MPAILPLPGITGISFLNADAVISNPMIPQKTKNLFTMPQKNFLGV
jgi:hypothetical protein